MLYFAKWKVALVLGICFLGMAFAAPNFISEQSAGSLPSWLPHKQMNLGLDLQGGSHLLLEVEVDAVIAERLESLVDSIRAELRKERIGYTGLGVAQRQAVTVRIREADRVDRAMDLIRDLGSPMAPDIFGQGGGVDIEVSGGHRWSSERDVDRTGHFRSQKGGSGAVHRNRAPTG